MRYYSQLIEATLLKRPLSFLMEVVLQSKRRIMLRCPNLGPLTGCDILGTQLWFSAPSEEHFLPTLELLEVNGGFLVSINQEMLKNIVIEAISLGDIKELYNYKTIITKETTIYKKDAIFSFLLEKDLVEQCYICLEHIIYVNDKYEAIFPINNHFSKANVEYLLAKKKQGCRAILLYCVMHNGAKNLNLIKNLNNFYINHISYAIANGVEILAYKANISLREIKLNQKIPIKLPIIITNSGNSDF